MVAVTAPVTGAGHNQSEGRTGRLTAPLLVWLRLWATAHRNRSPAWGPATSIGRTYSAACCTNTTRPSPESRFVHPSGLPRKHAPRLRKRFRPLALGFGLRPERWWREICADLHRLETTLDDFRS